MGRFKDILQQQNFGQSVLPQEEQQTQPQVDTSHALSSISQLMGPTPAEREAELRKQEAHNNKMMKWAGLFDGLRQLGNLYTTYKGATPQQLQAPYGQLIQQADRKRKLQAADDAYRKDYANTYMRLQHGINDDARKAKIAEAQAKYFDARGEMAQQKAELEKLKAVRVVKQKDGSLWKFDPVSGELEQLKESDPLYSKYVQSQIDKNNRMGYGHSGSGVTGRSGKDNGTYGYKIVEYIDEQGRKVKERIPTTGNNPNKAPVNQRERTVTTKEPKKKSAPQPATKKPQPAKRTSEKRKSKTSI